jgi:hypothetical protein
MPDKVLLEELSEKFSDIFTDKIVEVKASDIEKKDDDVPELPRIALTFDRLHTGRLRMLIDELNKG